MAGYRVDRSAEDIKRELSDIMRDLKDPRIKGMLSIVRLDLSNDLSYAKVYISAIEGYETAKESVKGLQAATGYIRKEIGSRLHIRKAPEFKFIADNSIEYGMNISKKIKDIL